MRHGTPSCVDTLNPPPLRRRTGHHHSWTGRHPWQFARRILLRPPEEEGEGEAEAEVEVEEEEEEEEEAEEEAAVKATEAVVAVKSASCLQTYHARQTATGCRYLPAQSRYQRRH